MTNLKIEYADILLVLYPFTDRSFAKQRPVVVVSRDEFNRSGDFIVLPLSSNVRSSDYEEMISPQHPSWNATGLRVPSAIKWTKPLTLHVSVVSCRLGRMPDDVMLILADRLRKLFDPPNRLSL